MFPDGGQVLLDRRLGMLFHYLLYISGHVHGLDLLKLQLSQLAPIRKPRHRDEVGLPGIFISNVGREKFPEAFTAVAQSAIT
jgi:hypothetical protein